MKHEVTNKIILEYDEKSAKLKSIMDIMALGIFKNEEITIKAEDSDEQDLMQFKLVTFC